MSLSFASSASAVLTATTKNWKGLDWYILNDYGPTGTELSGGNLIVGNIFAGTPTLGSQTGAAVWLNQGSSNNLTGISAANVAFWETMRTSSYAAGPASSPWVRWSYEANYFGGVSQNDLTINGPGGTASSVGSGPLSPEPGAFGGDRISVGSQFERAYDINHKGTGSGSTDDAGINVGGGSTTWTTPAGPYPGTDFIGRPTIGTNYDASNGDAITVTMGKRPDGTLDIYWEGDEIIGGPSHFTSTISTDNPDWFFYQLEMRMRDGGILNPLGAGQQQTYTNFEFGNDWASDGSGVLSELFPPQAAVPEPGSLALLVLGLIGFAARRRRRR